jgi:hypothetical protein
MKIRLKKSLSLPLVAVALASSTGAMADDGAKLSATGAVEARWYLMSSQTKAMPALKREELNFQLAINAVKDHTFAGLVFQDAGQRHGKNDGEAVFAANEDKESVSLVSLYKYFAGVDFGVVKVTIGNKQNTGFYDAVDNDPLTDGGFSTSKSDFYWFDDGVEALESGGITFEAPVNGWNLGLNIGTVDQKGRSNAYGVFVNGEVAGAKVELSTASTKGALVVEEAAATATTAAVTPVIADRADTRLAASAPVGPVTVGLEYVMSKASTFDAQPDGTNVGLYKKAAVPNEQKDQNNWAALSVSGSQPMGSDAVVYKVDYKMATQKVEAGTTKMKYDLNGVGLNVGYKMADMFKGGSLTPGVAVKTATFKDDVSASDTFEDLSSQRTELYAKYAFGNFYTTFVYRMDNAKGENFVKASDGAKTKKASSAFVKMGYSF